MEKRILRLGRLVPEGPIGMQRIVGVSDTQYRGHWFYGAHWCPITLRFLDVILDAGLKFQNKTTNHGRDIGRHYITSRPPIDCSRELYESLYRTYFNKERKGSTERITPIPMDNAWHYDCDRTQQLAVVCWSNRTPTQVKDENGKIFIPRAYDVVAFDNENCLHRPSPTAERLLHGRYFLRAYVTLESFYEIQRSLNES